MALFNRFKKPDLSKIKAFFTERKILSKIGRAVKNGIGKLRPKNSDGSFKFRKPKFGRPDFKEFAENTKEITRNAKTKFSSGFAEFKKKFPRNVEDLKKLRIRENLDTGLLRIRTLASSKSYGTYLRLAAATFAAYFLADTVSLFTDALIPDPPPVPAPRYVVKDSDKKTINEYSSILSRNIFNSKGLIPEENIANAPARKTNLPFTLIGTVVLKDELKSIAAIEDKSQNIVLPVRVDDIIESKAKITKIEHLRVYFINQSTGHLEYVEIIEDIPAMSTQVQAVPTKRAAPGKARGGITQKDETHFEVQRVAVDRALGNLHEVLQEARAVPNFENGVPDGYRLLQIVPNSIFDQLGLKNNDVFCGINGEAVNDPSKAFQLFNDLKTARHLQLCIKRNGKKMSMNYDIR